MKKSSVIKTLALLLFFLSPFILRAATSDNISGYAWSSNIGWISFNCTNDSSCGISNYGVSKDSGGNLTGYAWSPNIGWIQFGGLSGFPTGSGTTASNAVLSGSNLIGWAKALAADNNPWDGWISLAGTGYGITLSGTSFTGYAWGNETVGWISFDAAGASTSVALTGSASLDILNGGSSIVNNLSVPYGTIPTFSWTIDSGSDLTCSIAKTSPDGTAFATLSGITTTGTTSGNPLTDADYSFLFNCTSGATTVVSQTLNFTVLPQPPGFSLGTDDTANIQFLTSGSANSQTKTIFVSSFGGFNSPVSVAITGFPTPPASTTFSYSLNGSAFSESPAPVTFISPYTAGMTFQAQISMPVTVPYTVTLTGSASGYPSVTKKIIINPTTYNPLFQEL